jgi:hypothetical protein
MARDDERRDTETEFPMNGSRKRMMKDDGHGLTATGQLMMTILPQTWGG